MVLRTKIKELLTVVLLVSMLTTGCTQTAPNQPASAPAVEKSQTAAPVQVIFKVYSETFKDDNGSLLMEAKIISPEILNPANDSALASINEYYAMWYDDFIAKIRSEGLKKAKENKAEAQKNNFPFHPHYYERAAYVTYNGNNLLSVLSEQFESTGGAHPITFWYSQTFDVASGKKLTLPDLLGGSKEEALQKVYDTVLAQIKEKEGTNEFYYNESYQEDVKKYYAEDDFVLKSDSLVIYYQLYAIAPYAAGFREFAIPYAKAESFARPIASLETNDSERELYFQANQLIERNKTIFYEIYGLAMLSLKTPDSGAGSETIFPVNDERFTTFAELEGYIRNTYVKTQADALLGNGRYLDKNGKLYGDLSKDAGMGYYVDWNSYTMEMTDISDKTAVLKIHTVDNSPAGKENITLTVNLVKEGDSWLLEKMAQ